MEKDEKLKPKIEECLCEMVLDTARKIEASNENGRKKIILEMLDDEKKRCRQK
jgi:hypothetical protein